MLGPPIAGVGLSSPVTGLILLCGVPGSGVPAGAGAGIGVAATGAAV